MLQIVMAPGEAERAADAAPRARARCSVPRLRVRFGSKCEELKTSITCASRSKWELATKCTSRGWYADRYT